jgi:hypothetical protein
MSAAEVALGAGSAEQFSPRSVLLVEDNKDLADGVAELLRLHGVFVRIVARSADEEGFVSRILRN